jgi:endoglucanase
VTIEQRNREADDPTAPADRMRRRLLASVAATGAAIAFPDVARAPAATRGISLLPAGYAPGVQAVVPPAELLEWAGFRARFVTSEGRIVDTANGGTSHSEGQGYGLLLAEWASDLDAFERILDWTLATLTRQADALFAWQFRPDRAVPVEDSNSATDGDMAIAWALQRAGDRWGRPEWHAMAIRIARDILRLSVCHLAGRSLLLPGPAGFQHAGHVVINPSYYNFPAMRSLARLLPDPAWHRLEADGMSLLQAARFGRWNLPPDWIDIDRRTGTIPQPG